MRFSVNELTYDDFDSFTTMYMKRSKREVSEYDYIEYAELDLDGTGSPRSRINAIGNIKRAMHLRAEDLVLGFGGGAANLKNFHAMSLFLEACGVVRPRTLRRLNELRNKVEHAQIVPTIEQVETFFDVVHLFLAATDIWLVRQPCDAEFWKEFDFCGTKLFLTSISFRWGDGEVVLDFRTESERRNSVFMIKYARHDTEYRKLVGLGLKGFLNS